jgi:hypothetical protein
MKLRRSFPAAAIFPFSLSTFSLSTFRSYLSPMSLHSLLASSIDYAGLFPPAALDMATAVRQYAEYRAGPDAWALGRFVVPVARLGELERETELLAPRQPGEPWRLSALLGPSAGEEIKTLGEFNCRHAADGAVSLSADVVEARADSVEAVDRLLTGLPRWVQGYVEIPLDRDPAPLVAAIARHGARAKARTGGVTADAFPTAAALVRFIRACTDRGVPFKATAGLHHPLRAEYRLTYAPDSSKGTMFGFLNVFLAAAFIRHGLSDAEAEQLLEERSPGAFRFSDGGIEWRGHSLDPAALHEARAGGIVAFGSCSFEEPLGELRGLGWL